MSKKAPPRPASILGLRIGELEAEIAHQRDAARYLALQSAVVSALSAATTVREGGVSVIKSTCEMLGWVAGVVWTVDPEADALRCAAFWAADDRTEAFEKVTRERSFVRGVGLPGRVWSSGSPAWITDVLRDMNFPRGPSAAEGGLHAAFGIPITSRGGTVGVAEFFHREVIAPDGRLLSVMASLGAQIGQFVERAAVEEERARSVAQLEVERSRLRELFIHAPAAISMTLGPDHVPVFLNPVAEKLLGRRAAQIIGRPIRESMPELEGQGYFELLDGVYRTGESFAGSELYVTWDAVDGQKAEGYFNLVYTPLRSVDGTTEGVFSHSIEVTELVLARKRAEELAGELGRVATELQQVLRTREEFLSSAAHDIRSPLAAISGTVQLLQRRGARRALAQEEIGDALGAISESVNAMDDLVSDLLDSARIGLGEALELSRARVDLRAILQRAVVQRQRSSERHRIRLELPTDPSPGDLDAARIGRAIGNLIDNAIRYSPAGGEIVVTADVDRADGGSVAVVRVHDEGIGIPRDDLPRVFDRFFRGANVVGHIEGSGVGLATVKYIAESHGGSVDVISEVGQGTTFTMRLPLARTD